MKKTVFISFDHFFIKQTVETELSNCIVSSKNEYLLFYVFDEETTVEQFHETQKRFYNQLHVDDTVDDDYQTQKRFYEKEEQFDKKLKQTTEQLTKQLKRVDETNYTFYTI